MKFRAYLIPLQLTSNAFSDKEADYSNFGLGVQYLLSVFLPL